MPLNNAALIVAANSLRSIITHVQSHTDDPGSAYTANPTSAARQPVSWGAANGSGNFDLASPVAFSGIAANGPVKWVTLWGAITAGTCYGSFPLSGSLTADASGNYILQSLAQNGSAT